MQKIFTSLNRVKLMLLKSELDEAGIPSLIKNESPPAAGEVPSVIAYPELWIMNDEDFAGAKLVVQAFESKSQEKHEKWKCPNCHELIEGQFDLCWKCGNSRE